MKLDRQACSYGVDGEVLVGAHLDDWIGSTWRYSYGIILLEMITGRRPTDGPFEGGLSLRGLVEAALPRNVGEVLDSSLLLLAPHHDGAGTDEAEAAGRRGSDGCYEDRAALGVRSCVERLAELGLKCAADSPGDRPAIGRVYAEVVAIREAFSSAMEVSAAHG